MDYFLVSCFYQHTGGLLGPFTSNEDVGFFHENVGHLPHSAMKNPVWAMQESIELTCGNHVPKKTRFERGFGAIPKINKIMSLIIYSIHTI